MGVRGLRRLVGAGEQTGRVTTIELFFDLVFVFTITQLTHLVGDHAGPGALAQTLLVLCVTGWMYGGYAWLTNQLPPGGVLHRLLLVAGMTGFLTMALAIPHAFGRDGLAFGLAYLVVVLLHTGVFALASDAGTVRAVARMAPTNVGSALVVVGAGFVDGWLDWVLWPLAIVVAAVPAALRQGRGFSIQPAHFVERHGLIVIVTLGETVVALGAAAQDRALSPSVVAVVALGLLLCVALWWVYFDVDESRAEHALAATPPERRGMVALQAFGGAFVPLLLGIVLFAAGLRLATADAWEPAGAQAGWLLAGGVGLYVAGEAVFRVALGIGPVAGRFAAAGACAACALLAPVVPGAVLVAVLGVVLVVLLVAEARVRRRPAPAQVNAEAATRPVP
jgi:low temperature requirement protein LtrA